MRRSPASSAPILDALIDEHALIAFAADHGFVLSKRLVDAEIASLPQTKRARRQVQRAGLCRLPPAAADDRCRRPPADRRSRLTQRLVLAPGGGRRRVPVGVARPYAAMLLEQREGQLALVPADAFRAGLNPSDGDLQSFYAQNRQRYMVAEQRVLRIARIGPETVADVAPTEAEIAAYYKANQATYAGSETRVISQAVVQDKKPGRRDRRPRPVGRDLRRGRGARRAVGRGRQRRPADPRRIRRPCRRRRRQRRLRRRQGRHRRAGPLGPWLARHQDRRNSRRNRQEPGRRFATRSPRCSPPTSARKR